MKNFARGRIALSFLALIAGITYFQPRVGEAFNIADDAPPAVVQENQLTNIIENQQSNIIQSEVSDKSENSISVTIEIPNNEKAANLDKKALAGSFRATAYCLKGRTANGGGVRRGIVAADPRILPLGTRIYVNAGSYSGSYVVADTGGAVKGRILDVWVPNCSEAVRFGRKSVTVSILGR
ncbi:MAG: 3D domain-containing protein [Pyrinomonadaceae bacterium]